MMMPGGALNFSRQVGNEAKALPWKKPEGAASLQGYILWCSVSVCAVKGAGNILQVQEGLISVRNQ